MKFNYITVEREYGSGGTEIARRLAEKTGIPCYGREILEMVSEQNNISVKQIEDYEETVTGSFLYSLFMMSQTGRASADMLTAEGYVFIAEQAVIKQLAAGGRAIFLGHCASEALRDRTDAVHIFIKCSGEDEKNNRITQDYGVSPEQVSSVRKRFDKKRANYYSANTSHRWDDLKNYDLVLDSSVLGIDGCVDVLKQLVSD